VRREKHPAHTFRCFVVPFHSFLWRNIMTATKTVRASSVKPAAVFNGTRTAAQQKELDKMRAEKAARAKNKAQVIEPVQAASAPPEEVSEVDRIAAAVQATIMKMMGFGETDPNAPSWKRRLASFFACVICTSVAGSAISTLAGYAMVGIAMLSASVLWAYLIMILSAVAVFYAGLKVFQHVGGYISTGQIDKDIVSVKDKIVGWFKPKQIQVAA
jgi:hypothetical protein